MPSKLKNRERMCKRLKIHFVPLEKEIYRDEDHLAQLQEEYRRDCELLETDTSIFEVLAPANTDRNVEKMPRSDTSHEPSISTSTKRNKPDSEPSREISEPKTKSVYNSVHDSVDSGCIDYGDDNDILFIDEIKPCKVLSGHMVIDGKMVAIYDKDMSECKPRKDAALVNYPLR